MDNSILLLIIVKKGVNFGAFVEWLSHFGCLPKYSDYMTYDNDLIVWQGKSYQEHDNLGTEYLTEFEFNYLICFCSLNGYIK